MKLGNKSNETPIKDIIPVGNGTTNVKAIVEEDTKIEGKINSDIELIIKGKIMGEIFSKVGVTVDKMGTVSGEINAESVSIAGILEGLLNISNTTILKSSAMIKADISTKILTIEEGAIFTGKCKMTERK
jgi:cytoskeletal protein CcmA (bactofilin family)